MSRDYDLAVTFISSLQFAVYVWTIGRASCGKWVTARFFVTKNCTASRLKARTSFLYPFAMCLLDYWSRINELFLFLGDKSDALRLDEKQHGCTKQWKRSSNRFYIPAVPTEESFLFQSRVKIYFLSCYWIHYLKSLCLVPIFNVSLREFHFILL